MLDAEERLRAEMTSLWSRWVRVRKQMAKGWGNLTFGHRAGATVSKDEGAQELPWDAIDVDVTHKSPSTAMTLFMPRYRACVRAAVMDLSPVHFEVTWDLVQEGLGFGEDDMEYVHRECLQIHGDELDHAIRHASDHVLELLRRQLAHDKAWMRDRAAPTAT